MGGVCEGEVYVFVKHVTCMDRSKVSVLGGLCWGLRRVFSAFFSKTSRKVGIRFELEGNKLDRENEWEK